MNTCKTHSSCCKCYIKNSKKNLMRECIHFHYCFMADWQPDITERALCHMPGRCRHVRTYTVGLNLSHVHPNWKKSLFRCVLFFVLNFAIQQNSSYIGRKWNLYHDTTLCFKTHINIAQSIAFSNSDGFARRLCGWYFCTIQYNLYREISALIKKTGFSNNVI